MISASVKEYLARGGEIRSVPGFEGVAPLPERRVKEKPAPRPEARKAEPELTLEQISSRWGLSMGLLRKLDRAGRLPAHDSEGFNGKRRWSLELALEVERIAAEAESRKILDRIRANRKCDIIDPA